MTIEPHTKRWRWVFCLCLWCTLITAPAAGAESEEIRFGITPVFLDNQTSFLKEWQQYMERQLGRPVRFVQRQTYREITELMLQRQLEVAWVCGFPFVENQPEMQLLAVPVYQGQPLYQSYLIVGKNNASVHGFENLKGAVFAYSDPDSNSGYLVPRATLIEKGFEPTGFFRRTFFTWSHRSVVEAVASGLADGGSVDGYVWETLNELKPELTRLTRVVEKSRQYGFPPIVVHKSLPALERARLQEHFLAMAKDPEGHTILNRLYLDGFIKADNQLYAGIRSSAELVKGR